MLRFAPSPNGALHKGHALSALANAAMADALGKPLRLRMEDIDQSRCRPEHEIAIIEDLAWLGVNWQPPLLRQSDRFERYAAHLATLRDAGLLLPSVLTRKEIALAATERGLSRDPDGAPIVLDEAAIIGAREVARRIAEGQAVAFRLDMAEAIRRTGPLTMLEVDSAGTPIGETLVAPARWGNVVLARKETPTSYHLSVVTDDAEQAITHVVRGADLREATAVHRTLQALLGWPAPAYHHHQLILGDDGRKLSKSNGALSLAAQRKAGLTADALRNALGYA